MFSFLLQRPYLHLLLALCCGIAIGQSWALPVELLAGGKFWLLGCCLGLVGLWWLWRGEPSCKVLLPGFIAVVLLGYISASLAVRLPLAAPLRQYVQNEPLTLAGTVVSMPKYQRGHLRFMLKVTAVDGAGAQVSGGYGTCACFVKCGPETQLFMSDAITLTGVLEEVEPALNYGQFAYRDYLLQRGTVLTVYAGAAAALRRLHEDPPMPWGMLSKLRLRLMRNLARDLPPDYGELAISVVYGDKITDLPEQLEERFRRAGLTHILVASGTQVSLLILLLATLFCRVYTDFTWRSALLNIGQFSLTLLIVLGYAALTGFETSIARALAMGVLVLSGRLVHREADGLTSLAQSGLILLILNPLALSSAGFLLSFGATFGLIYAAGVTFPLLSTHTRVARGMAQTLATTSGAQLFVAPVLASSFHQLSLWGLLSNLAAIPTAFALLVAGGLCSLGLGAIPVLGQALTYTVLAFCWLLDWEARAFAALPGSNLAVPQLPWWWIAAYFALLFIVGEWIKNRKVLSASTRRALAVSGTGCVLLLAAGILSWWLVPRPELSALALPHCEAYLWRPYSCETYLLARAAGIERSHNAETITSALRFRGINKLAQVVWLDAPPEQNPLPDYPAPELLAGGAIPDTADLGWLRDKDRCIGARCALGNSEVWIVWDGSGSGEALALAKAAADAPGRGPALLLAGPQLTPRGVEAVMLAVDAPVVSSGFSRKQRRSAPDKPMTSEIRILPCSSKLLQRRFRPGKP